MEDINNKVQETIKNLTDEQKQLFADTINWGSWGDTDLLFNDRFFNCYGYITDLAHNAGHFERRTLSNKFKSLFVALGLKGNAKGKENDIMMWIYDWWEDGSGSVLFIREPYFKAFEDWAANYKADGDAPQNGLHKLRLDEYNGVIQKLSELNDYLDKLNDATSGCPKEFRERVSVASAALDDLVQHM